MFGPVILNKVEMIQLLDPDKEKVIGKQNKSRAQLSYTKWSRNVPIIGSWLHKIDQT